MKNAALCKGVLVTINPHFTQLKILKRTSQNTQTKICKHKHKRMRRRMQSRERERKRKRE